ncbi:hypothetical protein [Roseospirillum parvum]|uniref:Uncharacterized protein n=1 Tax=Roseospirillum parvum TaxID=83401 RepID=A0A1G8B2S8_9PROT|nr:hypothetical protein [Roseospirillum parvum]SDH27582.1 hypothetical protein SAMN05421742_105193 [Roseospirillum parvum]
MSQNRFPTVEDMLWHYGRHPARAFIEFAPSQLRKRYEELNAEHWLSDLTPAFEAFKTDNPTEIREAFEVANKTMNDRLATTRECQETVRKYLMKDALFGLGYVLPRSLEDSPKRVPAQAWATFLNWSKDTLEHHGLAFAGIRIVSHHWENEISKRWRAEHMPPPEIEKPSRGRPSRKEQIEEAIRTLTADGALSPEMTVKGQIQLVRQRVLDLAPDDERESKGLGDEVIRRALKEVQEFE